MKSTNAMNKNTPAKLTLSVIVCVVSDAKHLKGCLIALDKQVDAPPMKIIVPYVADDQEIQSLSKDFPQVIFHPVEDIRSFIDPHSGSREHHDELRAVGLSMATGDIVALIEDHGWADKYWARNIVHAHKDPYVAIGGAIENGVDRLLNWAVYYCDFGRYQNPVQPGPTTYISDANISYKRGALEGMKDVWNEAFHETIVNAALMNRGETLWLSPDIVVYQHRKNLGIISALRERYVWGRSFAGTRAKEISFLNRLIYAGLSPALPIILTVRKTRDVLSKKRLVSKFLKALPLTLLLTSFWSLGELMGYLTGKQHSFIGKERNG